MMEFYRKDPTSFFDPTSAAVIAEVLKTGDFAAYRALCIDDSAKLRDFPERGDFTKVAQNFVSCSRSSGFQPPSFPQGFEKTLATEFIHYLHDSDGERDLAWMATMEYSFFRPRPDLTVYQINFRLPNDGFLYLSPNSAVDCPIAEHVKSAAVVSDGEVRDAIPGWLELNPSLMCSPASLMPIQSVFVGWLKSNQLPKKPIFTNVFYNPSHRRLDIRLTYSVDNTTKIEWQLHFEPGFPYPEYTEHVITESVWDLE